MLRFARGRGLITIADAKRGDIGSTSAAYAEAFLGDGDFAADAITINPYLGADAIMPFVNRIRAGHGVLVLVKNSNPSSGEFQDLEASGKPLWEAVAGRVRGWGDDFIGKSGFSSIGAVVGATYPKHLETRARADAECDHPRTGLRHPGRNGARCGDGGARRRFRHHRKFEPRFDVRLSEESRRDSGRRGLCRRRVDAPRTQRRAGISQASR